MVGLKGASYFSLLLPVIICLLGFVLFLLLPQTALLACPRERGQLRLTRGQCDSYSSPQDTLRGSPIFSARGMTLPALILLWAANHERARRERERERER